jgi:battenin
VEEAEAEPETTDAKDHDSLTPLTVSEKLRVLRQLTPYLWALGSVYFFEYMINQSVDPVLVFPNSTLIPEKHQYTSYQLAYQIGVFVSRSSVNVLPIPSVWWLQIPSLLQAVNCVVLSWAAIHNFLPGVAAALAIIVFEGLMGGAVYVNTFMLIRSPSSRLHGKAKEFALGATSQSYGFAITLAGVIGLYWTPFLSRHADM